jgi:hypothetical protein
MIIGISLCCRAWRRIAMQKRMKSSIVKGATIVKCPQVVDRVNDTIILLKELQVIRNTALLRKSRGSGLRGRSVGLLISSREIEQSTKESAAPEAMRPEGRSLVCGRTSAEKNVSIPKEYPVKYSRRFSDEIARTITERIRLARRDPRRGLSNSSRAIPISVKQSPTLNLIRMKESIRVVPRIE